MDRKTIVATLLVLSLGSASAPSQAAQGGQASSLPRVTPDTQVLPMRFYGTRPAVDVRVNGQGPFLFLIDTGASGAARADVTLVQRLRLRSGGTTQTSDAGGASANIDRVVLDRVEVGGMRTDGVQAYSRSYNSASYLPRIDGILGFDFFRDVLLTLDYPHAQVRMTRGALPPADGRTVLDYQLVEGQPAISVRIGSRSIQVLLDTGNIRALDLPSDSLRTLPMSSYPRIVGNSSSVSGTVTLREVTLAEPLIIGQYRFENPQVTFADEFHEGNLGSTILRNFTVTIDQRNRRIQLLRVGEPSP
jgi:hypothetical protein